MLYFRSDDRQPEEVFREGFSVRCDYKTKWWALGINHSQSNEAGLKFTGESAEVNGLFSAVDANSDAAICLTTRFETAGLFPLPEADGKPTIDHQTYIYAIALPDATKIGYKKTSSSCTYPFLEQAQYTPCNDTEVVVDLHSLQATQVGNIANNHITQFGKWSRKKSLIAGGLLFGYEAIAYRVLPENIICAIKCMHQPAEKITVKKIIKSYLFTNKFSTRKFNPEGTIIINANFRPQQNIKVWSNSNPDPENKLSCLPSEVITKTFDYNSDSQYAKEIFQAALEKKEISTPTPYEGLGGKTF